MLDKVTKVSDSLQRWNPSALLIVVCVLMAAGAVTMMGYTTYQLGSRIEAHENSQSAQNKILNDVIADIAIASKLNAITTDFSNCQHFAGNVNERQDRCWAEYRSARDNWARTALR